MAGQTLTMVGMNAQIMKLRHEQNLTNRLVRDMSAKFAHFWRDEKRKCFAIITRLSGSEADLVVFDNSYSGGTYVIDSVPMLVRDSETPEDEYHKEGTWESSWDLPHAIAAAIEYAAKQAKDLKIEVDETASPAPTPKAKVETEEESEDASDSDSEASS